MSEVVEIPAFTAEILEFPAGGCVVFCTELATGLQFNAFVNQDESVFLEFWKPETPEQSQVKAHLISCVQRLGEFIVDAYIETKAT